MTYKEARVYLDEVSKYGSVLGLDTIRGLLCELGNPQKDLRFIHIAGTNGKGSVLAYTSTILSESGLKTGRYVSPTVLSYLERIQVDGEWISEEIFAELVEEVQRAVARMEADGKGSPTVFEIETAIAFLYFRKMKCDIVVLETGLGGSLDATNVVENTVIAAFATISRDHMGFLGETLSEIGENKAGIIKPGCVVVSAPQKPEVREVLERKAGEYGCLVVYAEPETAVIREESFRGQTFSYKETDEIRTGLAGRYQVVNVSVAYEVIRAWNRLAVENDRMAVVSEDALRTGFEKAKWTGRFTTVSENPVLIVDGAHNEDAAKRLRESVDTYFPEKKLIFIMGVFKDKEYRKIIDLMIPRAKRVYTVNLPDENRTLDAESLAEAIRDAESPAGAIRDATGDSVEVTASGEIEKAVKSALSEAENDDVILAFGSLSYLGRVIETVDKKEEYYD